MPVRRRHVLAGGSLLALSPGFAQAQSRADTLRWVIGGSVNSLDPVAFGATREASGFAVNFYDTLLTFGTKPEGAGRIFDFTQIKGLLAESFEISADGLTVTLHICRGATWHDATPVTAEDVKWSLDRAVSARTMSQSQIATGSMTAPEQFRVAGDDVVEIRLPKPDRMVLPNLAIPYVAMYNSKLAKQHVTESDPWATAWLRSNSAGGGAYIVDTFKPGEQVVLRRNESWKSGKLPFFQRVIAQTVPEAATRASLLERGDADISLDLQASDVSALEKRGKLKVLSIAQPSILTFLAFNTQKPPFDNVALRQAVAAALPYQDMFQATVFGRGAPLFGADWTGTPPSSVYPQPMPFHTDLALAKQQVAEAGVTSGLKTTLSFGVGAAQVNEPLSALIKEALGKIGLDVDIQKLPDAQMATAVTEKTLPMLIETSGALFPSTDYFFRIFYVGNQRWNFSSWNDAEVNRLDAEAKFERDTAKYDDMCKRMVALTAEQVPMVPLWKPALNAVMASSVDGFTYWYHRQLDVRDLRRA